MEGGAQAVPRDKIILRYRTALSEKEGKFRTYSTNKIITQDDIKVIALSGGALRRWPDSGTQPYILSAVFPLGHPFITISRETGATIDNGHHFQPNIKKANGAPVETVFFLDQMHADISAVIYSRSDLGNIPKQHGADLFVIHNPLAKNPLPRGCLRLPVEYSVEDIGDKWGLHSEEMNFDTHT